MTTEADNAALAPSVVEPTKKSKAKAKKNKADAPVVEPEKAPEGFYNLRQDGRLVYTAPGEDVGFDHVAFWEYGGSHGVTAVDLLVEALALHRATREGVDELAKAWGIDEAKIKAYCESLQIELSPDGNCQSASFGDFVNLAESICGFGYSIDDSLGALADLCQKSEYVPRRGRTESFSDIARKHMKSEPNA